MDIHDEKALLRRVALGDEAAFTLLFERCQPGISYVAYQMLHDLEDTRDVLQEIMSKVWQNRARLPQLDNFGAYLHTLTRNHIYDQFRKKANEDAFIAQELQKGPLSHNAFNEIQYRQLLDRLHHLMKQLPPQQYRAFRLSKLEGLRLEEVAGHMGIARETVKKHLKEALKTIRLQLQRQENGWLLCMLLALHN
ncbi:RNA polymerase sigma factor [Chitinophaga cymbidii]|uniref:DNA-directed RNA polymerase sigma-70 factor n=1 Tax=Chitinophaga cymbidii TaxID=1096750 RepID=A0A512RN61_9BACT|nr:sigma-70 family RNA polymerase sigma factor [Chitinophaga cymbidii]GEP97136.1 DNA-directed RNA polymerase sigma-70 factor [Chitinophaga cymbidii]